MSEETKTAENQIENPFAIFSTNIEDIKSFEENNGKDYAAIFYEPNPTDDGKPYIALIKFLPNIYSPINPLVKKFFYKLVNADTGKALYFDSPSTIGEACIVSNEYYRLNDSEDARDQKLKKKYKRTRQKCGVIQILKDPQQPELNEQLRLFRIQYEGDIDNTIKAKLNPTKEEMSLDPTLKPVNVFDAFSSPALKLKVVLSKIKLDDGSEISARDFAGSVWTDTLTGMFIDGKAITEADKTNTDIQKKIVELLKQEHLNIREHFEYKAADESRLALVKKSIAKMSGATFTDEPAAATTGATTATETKAAETTSTDATAATETKAEETVANTVVAPTTEEAKKDVFDDLGI